MKKSLSTGSVCRGKAPYDPLFCRVGLHGIGGRKEGIGRSDRAHQDNTGPSVYIDQTLSVDGGSKQGLGGTFDSKVQIRGPADSHTAVDLELIIIQFDPDQLAGRDIALQRGRPAAVQAQIEETFWLRLCS